MSRLTDKNWKNPESLMWTKLGLIPMRNEAYRASLGEALRKLAHYEDLEDDGKLAEITRCKNCIRHSDEYVAGADGISWCDEHEHLTNDDDYCSYAVAKLAEMEGEL